MDTKSNIRRFLNQHCRFKLRSGKEVFGVIWQVNSDEERFYFTSISDHKTFMQTRNPELISNKLSVDLDEIIMAERLVG